MVVTFEVVAFVLGAATGTVAEAGLTAGTAVVLGVTAESVWKEGWGQGVSDVKSLDLGK